MALGEFSMFTWKSKEQREKEQNEYAEWAFPYGLAQREKLVALMRELEPLEQPPVLLMSFLTCKELYEKYFKKNGSSEAAIKTLIKSEKQHKDLIKRKYMTTFISLVLADAEIDEKCEYPSASEIRERVQEIEKLRNK